MSTWQPDILEVIVCKSHGPRDPNLADAARRWWKIDVSRRHDLECIVARQHWRDDPLADSGSPVRQSWTVVASSSA